MRKLAAGNWKMNGTGSDLAVLADLGDAHQNPACEILICPPDTLIHRAAETTRHSAIAIGGQDCHAEIKGAHTGDTSAAMLLDAGARYVLTGHSERRADHHETNADIRAKTETALKTGLGVIVCLGESLAQRESGRTLDVIADQLSGSLPDGIGGDRLVVAYEPIWAIGTGLVPSVEQIGEVHDFIRGQLENRFGQATGQSIRLLYGGSVKPGNAAEIFAVANVDGALVGGASLTAADFSPIIAALEAS